MMGAMQQPPPSALPPVTEPNEELLRLRAEDAARRAREIKLIEDAEQAKRDIEMEATRKKIEKAEREEQAKAQAVAIQKGIENYKKLEEEKAKQEKAVKDVREEAKKTADEEVAKKLKEKAEEHKKELEKVTKEAEEAKKEAAALKGLPEDQQMVHVEIFAAAMPRSKKFAIPMSLSKSWKVGTHSPGIHHPPKTAADHKNRQSMACLSTRTSMKVLCLVLPWQKGITI